MIEKTIQEPYSLEAEEGVIASCLIDNTAYDRIAQVISPEDFFDIKTKILFKLISELSQNKQIVDEITLFERVKTKGFEEQIGYDSLQSIIERVSTSVRASYYAQIVQEKAIARNIIKASRIAIEEIVEGSEASYVSSKLEKKLCDISDRVNNEQSFQDAGDILEDKFKLMSERKYEFTALSTGIKHLDEKLDEGGIGKGEVFVISAPTSCGKSQLALNIVLRAAVKDQSPVGIFSFEMPSEQLLKRMVQTASAVNLKKFREGVATEEENKRVFDSLDKIKNAPIYVEHNVRNIQELRSKARSMQRKNKIEALVIDYLQLIPYDTRMSKNDGVSLISHSIKQLAMELNIPVILLAQVNREGAKRDSGLSMHDLRDSGDIENDADVILLMWAKGGDLNNCRVFDGQFQYLELDYKIAKNREGERDVMGKFKFINHLGRFQ